MKDATADVLSAEAIAGYHQKLDDIDCRIDAMRVNISNPPEDERLGTEGYFEGLTRQREKVSDSLNRLKDCQTEEEAQLVQKELDEEIETLFNYVNRAAP